jgi:PTS system nitrogen regulatory IIA component
VPFQEFNVDEVAKYLHLSRADVEALVKREEIPFEKRGSRLVFRQKEIDAWASQRILGFQTAHLDEYHQKSTQGTRAVLESELIMPAMVRPEYLAPAMSAKTKSSLLRALVTLAEMTGLVADAKELLQSLEEREALCSTGLPGGLAIPHPRYHQQYLFDSSFIIVGRTVQEIHFGAPDGQSTDLFFLLCCQDERLHLHTLARLCLMAQKTDLLPQLRAAADAEAMHACLVTCEVEALRRKHGA